MATLAPTITVRLADYADAADAARVVALLDSYARDPMGGGKPLSDDVRERLVPGLAAHAGAFSLLAFAGDEALGLANCITGFSTFAARPLVNIHDMAVLPRILKQAQRTRRIIRQNLIWASIYNLIAVPLAVLGFVTPWIAALGMSISSLIVVANALRLLKKQAD